MKAVIPAAGHGTRFLPVTKVVPKEMLPIGSRPALELIVEEAKSAGADEIVMVISKGKELIREYFKDDPAVSFVYQHEQKGLGHAVLQAAPENAPSDLAVAGRYLLDVSIFDYLAGQQAGLGGEIQLTDAIARMIAQKPLYGCVYQGKRQDIGNPQGYFKALEAFGEKR